MAGRVGAHLIVHRNGQSWHIEPLTCPVETDARAAAATAEPATRPLCQVYDPLQGRRSCPFWYATAKDQNVTHRVDGSTVWDETVSTGKTQQRVSVLCLGMRRNRPPGV